MTSPKVLAFQILRVLMKMADFSADSPKGFIFILPAALLMCFELILYNF